MRDDLTVALLVVVFIMEEVSGLSKPWCLVEVSPAEVRIVHDTLLVTLLIVHDDDYALMNSYTSV